MSGYGGLTSVSENFRRICSASILLKVLKVSGYVTRSPVEVRRIGGIPTTKVLTFQGGR